MSRQLSRMAALDRSELWVWCTRARLDVDFCFVMEREWNVSQAEKRKLATLVSVPYTLAAFETRRHGFVLELRGGLYQLFLRIKSIANPSAQARAPQRPSSRCPPWPRSRDPWLPERFIGGQLSRHVLRPQNASPSPVLCSGKLPPPAARQISSPQIASIMVARHVVPINTLKNSIHAINHPASHSQAPHSASQPLSFGEHRRISSIPGSKTAAGEFVEQLKILYC